MRGAFLVCDTFAIAVVNLVLGRLDITFADKLQARTH